MTSADEIIRTLALEPHPEGGWFRETWRASPVGTARSTGTAIYYLLKAGEHSHWHRIDATEIWHFYAGAALQLDLSECGEAKRSIVLGPDISAGQKPQAIVPPRHWQAARSLGDWTLVGCTVSPAFEFAGFELAPDDWHPAKSGDS